MLYLLFCAQIYLAISTTIAGKCLTFQDNITANGWMIFYVGADYISHMTTIHFAQKHLGTANLLLIHTYGFVQYHMIRKTVYI